ncbi:hypothetical protein EM68_024460 [Vibrio parahaemolyticus]|nr:hypothetical protein EM68_024460 [Vibrio parahaemolyticus]
MTSNLRVIRHAWHFYYALVLVAKVACRSIGMCFVTLTLSRRYVSLSST